MARIQRCLRVIALLGLSQALVAPSRRVPAPRQQTITHSTPAEVAIAAQTQLLSLAAVTTGEGIWSTVSFGFSVGRAIQCLAPPLLASVVLVGASGSVGSGVAGEMAPGLLASSVATLGLVASYASRLSEKQTGDEGDDPPKEVIGLFAVLAFFGFATATQSLFAAGILGVPQLPDFFGSGELPDDLGL
jgi:hypothetical protein